MKHPRALVALLAVAVMGTGIAVSQTTRPGTTLMTVNENGITHIPVILTRGHDTDPRDHGRPVVLVAAGLNVPTEVFRKAFSGVKPAPAGRGPTGDEARRNKAALLKVLGPYGVTNDRLDEVSNRYRYWPGSVRLWTRADAQITADVRNGKIIGFTITNPGAGYTTPPAIDVPGFPDAKAEAKISFSTDLEKNGAISAINFVATKG